MALGDNPRFVVMSMNLPKPQTVYADLYYARGQAENSSSRLSAIWPQTEHPVPPSLPIACA